MPAAGLSILVREMYSRLAGHLIWCGRWSAGVTIVERLVPDELWGLFQRVVPPAPTRPQGGGRRRHGDHEVLAAIILVATSGCTWQQLPSASFGPSGATAHRRFTEWTRARVCAKLHRLVPDEPGARGELDRPRCAIDSVNMRALKRGGADRPESKWIGARTVRRSIWSPTGPVCPCRWESPEPTPMTARPSSRW
jgi:transposase